MRHLVTERSNHSSLISIATVPSIDMGLYQDAYRLHTQILHLIEIQICIGEAQTADAKIAVPSVLSVMRNVSVPFGINTPEKPYISSTRWRSVSDQKNKVYYFESTLTPNMFWLDLKKIDFSPKAGIKKLSLTKGEIYAGDAVKDLKDSQSFTFLFQTPVM